MHTETVKGPDCQAKLLQSWDPDRQRWFCPKCGPNIYGPCERPDPMTDEPAPASPDYRAIAKRVAQQMPYLTNDGRVDEIETALRSAADTARGEERQKLRDGLLADAETFEKNTMHPWDRPAASVIRGYVQMYLSDEAIERERAARREAEKQEPNVPPRSRAFEPPR